VHLDGHKSFGGYALYNRSPSHFVVKIPDGLPSSHAAPMLCAGVTMYSPLRHFGCGPGKSVAVVGLGGLGHFGVLWAKALGADRVVALSRRESKRVDALALGADDYLATADDPDWASKGAQSFDIVISTVSSSKVCVCRRCFERPPSFPNHRTARCTDRRS
jgi:alcohol dehydrogenase (NADP+)